MKALVYKRPLLERVLHWGLALSVGSVLVIFEDGDTLHRYVGYFAFGVVLIQQMLRFMRSPKKLVSSHPRLAFLVHSLIWLLVGLLALSGWMMSLDRFWGEDWLERLHEAFSWSLVVLIAVHLVGILGDAYQNKRCTWMLMITKLRGK